MWKKLSPRGLGQMQAASLRATGAGLVMAAEQEAARAVGLGAPIRSAADAINRVEQVQAQQDQADTAVSKAQQVGELAATAVASALSLPSLPKAELVEIAREYLSGLVEASGLKDVFAGWAEHLAGAVSPPSVEAVVVPDADRLQQEALADFTGELDAAGDSAAVSAAKATAPLEAAAGLLHQAYTVQQNNGDCGQCGSGDDSGGGGQDGDDAPGGAPIVFEDGG